MMIMRVILPSATENIIAEQPLQLNRANRRFMRYSHDDEDSCTKIQTVAGIEYSC
jgi:hypothetical protein